MAEDTLDRLRVEIAGHKFFCIFGSDVDRDGVYLELSRADKGMPGEAVAMEVFYSDKDGSMVVSIAEPLPVAVVEWMISEAKI